MGLLVTLGWIALVIGLVLVVLGFTVAPQALRPGYGAAILGVVLVVLGVVLGYLLPNAGLEPRAHADCITARTDNPVTLCTQGDARQSNTSPVPVSLAEPWYPYDCGSDWECSIFDNDNDRRLR